MSQALYDLPEGWEWVELREVCNLQNGFAFKASEYVEKSNTVIIRMGNIRPGGYFDAEHKIEYLPDIYAIDLKDYILNDGDLIIAMTDMASEIKILGVPTLVCNTNGRNFLLNQRVGRLYGFKLEKVSVEYLRHVLSSNFVKAYYKKLGGGGLQINIGKSQILSVNIPLPPLAEQTRIVEKLDAVLSRIDTAIDELQQSLALVDAMFKSGLDGLFSFNADVKIVKLGSLGKIIRGSSPRPKGDPKYYGGNIPRLMVADVTRDGRVVFPRIDFLTEEGAKKSRPVPKGTLTIQVSGNPGVPAILGVDACIHDGFAALVEIGAEVDINYLYFYLFYFSEKNQKQAVGAIFKNLTTDQLRQIDISLPDIDIQKKCVVSAENFAKKTTQLKSELTAKIGMFNQLKASVLDGAFRGEV